MSLTAKDVAEILRLLEESTFDDLTLQMDGVKLTLQRGASGAASFWDQTVSGRLCRSRMPAPCRSMAHSMS